MLAWRTPFIASEQLWSSPAFTEVAASDTCSFYIDIIFSVTLLKFDVGWYSFLDAKLALSSASIAAVAIATRYIEKTRPATYGRWRLPLLRLARYQQILMLYWHALNIRTLPATLTDADIEAAFTHHKITFSPCLDSFRILMLATGGAGVMAFMSRHLPFPEQLVVHAIMAVSNNVLMARPALRVLSNKVFSESMLSMCSRCSAVHMVATMFVLPSLDPDPFKSTKACHGQNGQTGLIRLVLFTQFVSIFIIPVYYCYQYEARLKAQVQHYRRHPPPRDMPRQPPVAAAAAAAGRDDAWQLDAGPFNGPWWKLLLVDALALAFLATMTWTMLLGAEHPAMAAVDRLGGALDAAEAAAARLMHRLQRH